MSVYPGTVADHSDEGGNHMAVVLGVDGDLCEALFFTSNPNWSDRSRRASRDELAMAGFVHTKTTYLAYVVRPTWTFEATELTYPSHWVTSLRHEFQASISRVIEVA